MQEEDVLTINFKELFRILWKEKWWIIGITLIFGIAGVVYALIQPNEFVSKGKILPEVQGKSNGLGQYAGLAAMAGIDLGGTGSVGSDAIRPDLYPDVIATTPFYLELLKAKVRTQENKELTFEVYYHQAIEKGEKIDEKRLSKYPVKQEGVIVINRLSEERLKDLRSRLSSSIDKKSGVISISAKMQDPVVAADVTLFAMEYLMEYIKGYRTEKFKKNVEFLEDKLGGSRSKYYASQQKKASYADQFQMGSIRLQSADVQRERLDLDYKVNSGLYNEILKQYEEAKFLLHKETPVFQVLEPPVVPTLKSEPKRSLIVLGTLFLGGVVAVLYTLVRKSNYKAVIKNGN